jgi:ribonuclease HI
MREGNPRPGSPPSSLRAGGRKHAGRLILYVDGASRGNPGPAAWGVWSPSGLAEARAIGVTTNNVAEWQGFLAALEVAAGRGASDVEIRADSELVVKQFRGEYRVKAEHLKAYVDEARRRAAHFGRFAVHHVPREENREADALANGALDETGKTGR